MIRRAGPLLALVAALACAGPAAATQDAYPALYNVRGVASNDVLNVRAEPTASAPIVGSLAFDQMDVEVLELAPGVNWGLVNTQEGTGWVSLAYMLRQPGQYFGAFPEVARCSGTEPFWGLSSDGIGYVLSGPDMPDTAFSETWRGSSIGRRDRHAMTLQSADPALSEGTAVIAYAECSDGMSDRQYGLTVDLLLRGTAGVTYYTGCCTLQP
ncbi:SH3 domain-containing protein [Oceanicola sp. 22II-s10i]|uniref:SH3 domain-containing protein n=1 Tax=Oceanicola sp. 22II-s10i TaxID=1317116 RepID=UPI000B523850|nr:SH3 domain-containing protein [Oceanicola sp. 22II-s10i]